MTWLAVLLALSFSQNYLSVNAAPVSNNLASSQNKRKTQNLHNEITSQTLLDRWAEALGGHEKLTKIITIHTQGFVHAGELKGIMEDFQTMQTQHRASTNLAELYKETTVFNGKQGWIVDQNNILRKLDGNELHKEIQVNYLATFSHLLPDRLPGKVQYLGQDRLKKYYILKITPQDGQEILYYLDKKTYLPTKSVSQDDDETAITYYSDWREVEGIKFSFQQRETGSKGEQGMIVNIEHIYINSELATDTFNKPAQIANYKFTKGQNTLSIPIELVTNHIFLKVSVNGSKPLNFVLDSGAPGGIIDESLARKLLLKSQGKIQGSGIGEKTGQLALISNVSLSLPGLELTNLTLFSTALASLGRTLDLSIDGVLGYDFISQFVVEIDYANKILSLYDPQNYQYSGNGQVLPITLDGTIPNIDGKITTPDGNTLDIRCQIDTGSGSALDLTSPFVEKHQLLKSSQKMIATTTGGFGGKSKIFKGRINNIQIGSFIIDNPIIGFSQANRGTFASATYDANLGGEIFRRFKVIFDYQNQKIIFEPNKNFSDPFETDMSGLILATTGRAYKTLVVDTVREDSSARDSGIRKGDLIIDIDGELSENFTLSHIAEMFKLDGREYSLTLQRGKKTIKTKIRLRKSL